MEKYRVPIETLEELRSEVMRLVNAAGAEGNKTPAFQLLDVIDEGIRQLIVAAEAGADAHPYYRENLENARRLLRFT